MIIKQDEAKDEAEDTPAVVPLRLITGGIGGGDTWLSSLPTGAIFLAKNVKDKGYVLSAFQIVNRSTKGVYLYDGSEGKDNSFFWVSPILFSKAWEFVELLQVIDMQQKSNEDGNTVPISS